MNTSMSFDYVNGEIMEDYWDHSSIDWEYLI